MQTNKGSRFTRPCTLLFSLASMCVAHAQTQQPASYPEYLQKCKTLGAQETLGLAENGNVMRMFCAGLFYATGSGVAKDESIAARYFERAANAGLAAAQYRIGTSYQSGDGVPKDFARGLQWLLKAAQQNFGEAQDQLGLTYYNAWGVPKDVNEAERWFRLGAANGNGAAANHLAALKQPRSTRQEPGQELLADALRMYNSGNKAGAAKPMLAAAQAGNSVAQTNMGWHYENGVGVPKDFQQAAAWYRKGAENGNPMAMKNLGQLYELGQGVPEDWLTAAKWYRMSADLNYADGQTALSRAYQFGIGVPQNRKLAIEWDRRAAAQQGQAGYYARWLQDPSNFIGFRNEQEHALVINGQLRTEIPFNDPVGVTFKNSAERLAFLRFVRQKLDSDEAYSRWYIATGEYQRCASGGGSGCTNPGPPPK